jgi:catechol 2,3-dioxygenase-like lactoylglutathione lyase family enzyme
MIKGLHYVVLFSNDTDVSRDWYGKLGFEYLRGFDGMHWFKLGAGELMIHPDDGKVVPQGQSLHAAVEDVDAYFRHVVAQGFRPVEYRVDGIRELSGPVTRPWGDREFELADPDGHRWAFTERHWDGEWPPEDTAG